MISSSTGIHRAYNRIIIIKPRKPVSTIISTSNRVHRAWFKLVRCNMFGKKFTCHTNNIKRTSKNWKYILL